MILERLHPSVLLLVAGLSVPVGCGTMEQDADSFGSLSLHLTDTPDARIERAVVTISRIELRAGGEPVVLRQTPVTVDLVALSNATAPLVENVVLPTGHYPDLRFAIEGAYIIVSDSDGGMRLYSTPGYSQVPLGQSVDGLLKTPSWDASGFKVHVARGDGG